MTVRRSRPNAFSYPWLEKYALLSASLLVVSLAATAQESLYDEVDMLLTSGYSPNAVYYHEVAKGNTIYTIVDAAAKSDPDREAEFLYLAESILSELGRSACAGNFYAKTRDSNVVTYDSLEPKSVEEVARLFFTEDKKMARFGENNAHGQFPVKELAQYLDENSLWYRVLPVRNHPVPGALFVSLYADGSEIVVDGNLGVLQDAIDRGDESVAVVFHYYREDTIPVGRLPDEISGKEVVEMYAADSIKVSQPPNWKAGDYNAMMKIEDVEELVSIPGKDDIDPELWDQVEADIKANGFSFPVILVLSAGEAGSKLHNSVERVAVAKELGNSVIPVAFVYRPPEDPSLHARCIPEPLNLAGNQGGPSVIPPPPIIPPIRPVSP